MRFGVTYHVSITLLGLIVLATGLTSFVILSFWLREAASSFAREKEMALTLLGERSFYRTLSSGHVEHSTQSALQRFFVGSGALLGCVKGEGAALLCTGEYDADADSSFAAMLSATQPQRFVRRLSGRQWVGVIPSKRYLDLAYQIDGVNQSPVSVVLRYTLDQPYEKIEIIQRYIALYLGVNIIILMVIGYYRLRDLILLPIHRLLQLTISYRDEHGVPFLVLQESNELAQLYVSMQQMLQRIKTDREKLQKHVASLELANQQLCNRREEMVRAEKLSSVGRLAAGLAHEIGNPLGIIQGYLGLIRQDDVVANDRLEYCQRAEQELDRVNQLVRQLLNFARPATGNNQLIDPHSVINEALALLKPQPLFDGIVINRCYLEGELKVWCDPAQLLQVLLNCLLNAVDAIRVASDPGCLLITTEYANCDESPLRISIADNGCGLPDDELSAAFDPFFTTKAPGKGTGLGLSVSYALLQSMGGTITLTNRHQGGAIVTIELPVHAYQSADQINKA